MFSAVQSSTQTPGPGAYETDKLHSFGGTLSLKMKIRDKFTQNQGYISNAKYVSPRSSLSGIKHSIGNRFKTREIDSSVGPCFLPDPKSNFSKGVTIKKRYEQKDKSGTPGPGKYSPEDPVHTVVPAQRNRGPLKLSIIPDSPGPAAYEVSRDFSKDAHSFSIRPKTSYEPLEDENPGYTFNNPGQLGKNARKSSFGKANRSTNYETVSPGPGTYDIETRTSTAVGPYIHENIERKGRRSESAETLYDIRKYPEIKNRTISRQCGKRACDTSSDTPGPSYFPNTTLDLRPLSIHNKFDNKLTQHTPGPGDYTPMSPGGMTRLPCTLKGPSERSWFTPDEDIPGPAAYNVEVKDTAPSWTIGDKSFTNRPQSAFRPAATVQGVRPVSVASEKVTFSSTQPVNRK